MTASLKIDREQYGAVLRAFSTLPGEVDLAEIRALNKTAKWVKTRAVRETSQAAKVAAKVIRKRIRVRSANRRDKYAKVWSGLNPIPARDLGRVRQTARGTRAGRHFFPHAFVTALASTRTGIFRRVAPGTRRTAGRPSTSSPNLPIEQATLALNTSEVQNRINRIYSDAGGQFVKALRQEINYIVNVAKRKRR